MHLYPAALDGRAVEIELYILMISNSVASAIGAVAGIPGEAIVELFIGGGIITDQWERVPINVSVGMQPLPKTPGSGINPSLSLRFPIGT